jgi:predicted  nucleic acid-binding Zn-ribbon protein
LSTREVQLTRLVERLEAEKRDMEERCMLRYTGQTTKQRAEQAALEARMAELQRSMAERRTEAENTFTAIRAERDQALDAARELKARLEEHVATTVQAEGRAAEA